MRDTVSVNRHESKMFIEPSGIQLPDNDGEHLRIRFSGGDDLDNKTPANTSASELRQDVESANTSSPGKGLVGFSIQSGNGDDGVAGKRTKEDFIGPIKPIRSGSIS